MFDDTNLSVLPDIERQIYFCERLKAANPMLSIFIREHKAVVLAETNALLKLIIHDVSGNTVSLAEEFDDLLRRENITKHENYIRLYSSINSVRLTTTAHIA